MVHILHLVSSMPEAISEVARVVEPRGVLLHATTREPDESPWQASADIWAEALAPHGFERRRRPETEDMSVHSVARHQHDGRQDRVVGSRRKSTPDVESPAMTVVRGEPVVAVFCRHPG